MTDPHPLLHTPLCDILGCEWPVLQAGMGGVARSGLVGAVTAAGGYGFLGMVREAPALIRAEIQRVRALTDRPFGVNIIPAATEPRLLAAQVDTCIDEAVASVCLFWDVHAEVIRRFTDAGITVCCQVGDVDDARAAADAGAAVIIGQGREAGGHVRGDRGLITLIPALARSVPVPVVASGGIADGHGLLAARALGAQGVHVGTAFLATTESFAHEEHKAAIVAADRDTTIHTDRFPVNWPPNAPVRVLPNSVTRGERGLPSESRIQIGEDAGKPIWLFSTDSPLRTTSGDLEAMPHYAGQAVAVISNCVGAGERLSQIVREAVQLLAQWQDAARAPAIADQPDAPASPPCAAAEVDPAYMGLATSDEIVAGLRELHVGSVRAAYDAAVLLSKTIEPERRRVIEQLHRVETLTRGLLAAAARALGVLPETIRCRDRGKGRPPATAAGLVHGQRDTLTRLQALLARVDNPTVWALLEFAETERVTAVTNAERHLSERSDHDP